MQKIEDLGGWAISLRNSNKVIIVEGKKDKEVLSSFGIKNIITINQPLFQLVEFISEITNECVLLLDLDKEGKKLYSYLKRNLERRRIKIDDKYRKFLFNYTRITNIEGLKGYL